jgi:putative membrane protein
MHDQKTKFQQQVLFDEGEGGDSVNASQSIETEQLPAQQLIIDNQAWQAAIEVEQIEAAPELLSAKPHWLWRALLVLGVSALSMELIQFFINGFAQAPISTSLYAAMFACIAVLAGSAFIKEVVNLRRFKRQQQRQHQAYQALTEGQILDARTFCQQLSAQLPSDLLMEYEQQWLEASKEHYTDEELLQLYDKLVLSKVDQRAITEIAKFASESVVLIALSPVAIIDMLIMFWRNMRMVDKIAGLYGLRLGYWSRIKLIKQVFINMVYAGGSELIADLGTDLLGADMLGKFSTRLAQGAGAGMLTARLGMKTLKLCRPLPFVQAEPKIALIRQQMLKQIKTLVLKTRN